MGDDLTLEKKKEKALKTSLKEGAFNSFSVSLGDTYITPFALALKANTVHIGLISSLIGLLSPIAQFYSNKLMKHHSRKNIAITFGMIQAFLWIPIALIAYANIQSWSTNNIIYLLIALYTGIAITSGFVYTAWFSWLGDLVPEKTRGKYFGKRTMYNGITGVLAIILGAFILDLFKTRGLVLVGFFIIFSVTSIIKLASLIYLKEQYAPAFKQKNNDFFSLWAFIKNFDNFGKFAVYYALFHVALMIASPFYSVYMLQELQFSYITFMAVALSGTVFHLVSAPLIGKWADRYGNKKIFVLGAILLSANPFLWMVLTNPWHLIFIAQLLVGIANACLAIAVTDFVLDSTSQRHRGICISYTNILTGVGIFIGALLGGFLIKYVEFGVLKQFMLVFLISGITRFAVSIFILPQVKEIRRVKQIHLTIPSLHHLNPFRFFTHHFESLSHMHKNTRKV